MDEGAFASLVEFLERTPAVSGQIRTGSGPDSWWVQFTIDIEHPLAWHVVQELGSVVNYLSLEERLPAIFKPVSPPPYMNGGPADFLSWVIESNDPRFRPGTLAKWLEGRLPRPVDDLSQWGQED